MQPVRIIKVTKGKTVAYDLAASHRARGAQVTTTNIHGRTYEIRIYREALTLSENRARLASLLQLQAATPPGTVASSKISSDIALVRSHIKACSW